MPSSKIAIGYFIDYRLLNAVNYGVPQNRERLFVIGHRAKFNFPKLQIKKITVEKLASELSGGDELVQFIDIRDKEKFNQGHIPRSINLPLPHLEANQKAISPVKKAVVYGENEEEASKAAVILFDLNFFNVYVLDGGLASWKNNNGKIVSDWQFKAEP